MCRGAPHADQVNRMWADEASSEIRASPDAIMMNRRPGPSLVDPTTRKIEKPPKEARPP